MNIFKKFQLALIACSVIGSAHAGPIDFTFTDPATITFDSGVGVETFSGGFTYDVDLRILTNVNVTMSGNVNTTFIGGFLIWNNNRTIGLSSAGDNDSSGILAYLQFDYRLDGLASPSLLVGAGGNGIYNTAYGNAVATSSVGGVAVPTNVPEPVSLLLLVLGLGGLGITRKLGTN